MSRPGTPDLLLSNLHSRPETPENPANILHVCGFCGTELHDDFDMICKYCDKATVLSECPCAYKSLAIVYCQSVCATCLLCLTDEIINDHEVTCNFCGYKPHTVQEFKARFDCICVDSGRVRCNQCTIIHE